MACPREICGTPRYTMSRTLLLMFLTMCKWVPIKAIVSPGKLRLLDIKCFWNCPQISFYFWWRGAIEIPLKILVFHKHVLIKKAFSKMLVKSFLCRKSLSQLIPKPPSCSLGSLEFCFLWSDSSLEGLQFCWHSSEDRDEWGVWVCWRSVGIFSLWLAKVERAAGCRI